MTGRNQRRRVPLDSRQYVDQIVSEVEKSIAELVRRYVDAKFDEVMESITDSFESMYANDTELDARVTALESKELPDDSS